MLKIVHNNKKLNLKNLGPWRFSALLTSRQRLKFKLNYS